MAVIPKRKRPEDEGSGLAALDGGNGSIRTPASQKRARFEQIPDDDSTTSDYAASTVTSLADATHITRTAVGSATPFTETSSIQSRSKPRPKKYACTFPDCNKAYNRPIHLQTHINSHTGQRPHVCGFEGCDKSFIKVDHLNRHIRDKHGHHKTQVCNYMVFDEAKGETARCGKTFPTEEKYKRHLARHEQKEETRCSWENCGKVFRKQETLQRHIRRDHLNELPFVCTRENEDGAPCTEAFRTANLLQSHVNRQHEAPRYVCSLCQGAMVQEVEQSTNTNFELDPDFFPPETNSAIDVTHDDMDESILRALTLEEAAPIGVQSPEGTIGFATFNELSYHMKVVHPPTCTECGKVCRSARDLTAHIDIHHPTEGSMERRAAKKVSCPYPDCARAEPGNGFTSKGNMETHIRTVHKLERRFVCGEFDVSTHPQLQEWDRVGCGMRLVNKSSLVGHIKTQHLGLAGPQSKRAMKDKKQQVGSKQLSLLTGAGYEESRPIACLQAATHGCQMRFTRVYDLGVHMELTHGWQVDDINEAIESVQRQTLRDDGNDLNGMNEVMMCLDPLLDVTVP